MTKDKRKPFIDSSNTPGPGNYSLHIKPNSPSSPKYSMVGNHSVTYEEKNPGPADYNPSYSSTKIRPSSVK